MAQTPAGWHPAPDRPGQLRYWDGAQWTEHFHTPTATTSSVGSLIGKFVRRAKTPPSPTRASNQAPTIESVLSQTQLEAPRHPLDEQVEVVGEQFHTKGIRRVFAECSMPITAKGCTLEELQIILMPEPWNPHDPNAVAVLVGRHMVGHIPADIARDYAGGLGRLAAAGYLATGQARIWAKDEGSGMIRARVTALIPEAHQF